MKLFILLIIIQYSIFLNCFFSNFDINLACKTIATYKSKEYVLFYCKEKNSIDIYKFSPSSKNITLFSYINAPKNALYFVDFVGNKEILLTVTPKKIKITIHKIAVDTRKFIYGKILKNKSSINEFSENIFVDVNCDGYSDILIPCSNYYALYIFTKIRNSISFKFLRKLYFGIIETRRKPAPYDNMWFKFGYTLPKISSFKYKKRCFNLVHYSSAGVIYLFNTTFKKRIARINTARIKDKYEEFIIYPRPQPLVLCDKGCKIIHFANKKGIIYTNFLYYPYKGSEIQLVNGTIINFYTISKNIFLIMYLPKMGFLGFYELLTKNILEIKLGLVKNENNKFTILFEIPLTVKINLKEGDGFITVQSSNFVCLREKNELLEITFSEKDAIYKYTIKIHSDKSKVEIKEKLKKENPLKSFDKYECFRENSAIIIYTNDGKIKYYQEK